jgi:hypothetical protein
MLWDRIMGVQFYTDSITAKLQSLVVQWLMDISNKLNTIDQAMLKTGVEADLHARQTSKP